MLNKPEFYEKLRSLLDSGISVKKALEILSSRERGPLKDIFSGIKGKIDSGETLAGSFGSFPKTFTPFETSLIRAGEVTGNLEINLKFLEEYLGKTRAWKRKIITGLIYPFILFHAAVLLPPLSILIMEGLLPYIRAVRGPFILLYASFAFFFILRALIRKSPCLSFFFEKVFWRVPVSGKIRRSLALSRFLKSLGFALKAGLNADSSLRTATVSSGSLVISRSMQGGSGTLKYHGITGVLADSGLIPGMLLDLIYTGEESGAADDALIYCANETEKAAETLMERLIIILPVVVYLGVALYIAVIIIRFYSGLYGSLFY